MYQNFLKPIIDFIVALIALLVLSPLLLFVAIALSFQNKGNPFFLQKRPGKDEHPFYIIKFKTMTDARDEQGNLLPDNIRITKIGSLVRSLSIDELPQLINILKGEMSLVGPRPLLFKYIPLYSPKQKKRHDVRPGVTGWAQVNGRNNISWSRKLALDIYYVEHISFLFDIKILIKTVQKVILREGINQSNDRPMEPFTGDN